MKIKTLLAFSLFTTEDTEITEKDENTRELLFIILLNCLRQSHMFSVVSVVKRRKCLQYHAGGFFTRIHGALKRSGNIY